MYYLFKDSPARSMKYEKLTSEKRYPMKFCTVWWLEDVPVATRALEVWPAVSKFISALTTGPSSEKSKLKSFKNLQEHILDPLVEVRLHFFIYIAKILNPFLEKFQTSSPMAPYLAEEIQNILKTLMFLFVKRSVLEKADTIRKLARIDTSKNDSLMTYKEVSVSIAAKGLLTTLINAKKVSTRQVMEFKQECILVLETLVKKLLERSPIHYELVHYLPALDPRYMVRSQDAAASKMEKLLTVLAGNNWITAHEGDEALREYKNLVSNMVKDKRDEMIAFNIVKQGLDLYFTDYIEKSASKEYITIWKVIKMMLILSHGQAQVERGFSVNKDLSKDNMSPDTIIAFRQVYDSIQQYQCPSYEIPVNSEMLKSCKHSRSRYEIHLENKKKKAEAIPVNRKRKELETEIAELKVKKRKLENLVHKLENDADDLSKKAETKSDLTFLVEANAMRDSKKRKQDEITSLSGTIECKTKKLKEL